MRTVTMKMEALEPGPVRSNAFVDLTPYVMQFKLKLFFGGFTQ